MPAKDVDIKLQNGIPVATPDPVRLNHRHGHTVLWHNHLDESVTITFDKGTPFHHGDNPYTIPAGKRRDSGAIKVPPGNKPWKYTIKTASGKVNDPQVIVEDININDGGN